MLFNSYTFLFGFFPCVLVGHWILDRPGAFTRAHKVFLLAASWVFYGWWDPKYLALIIAWTLEDYAIARSAIKRLQANGSPRSLVIAGVVLNLGLLGYFKYFAFLVRNVNWLTGADLAIPKIVLPLAISFHTFQQIAFLVDVGRGRAQVRSALDYALFVCFFPQLIAGPIVHHSEFLPQLEVRRTSAERWGRLAGGLSVFTVGLCKKVLLADTMETYVRPVFDAADKGLRLSSIDAWIGSLAYTFQIYFDFSGYSDMAVGLALCLGIVLPANFNSPYKATSISEFWRRWHITLSRFLRDYLYIGLGGNRRGPWRRRGNLLITMLLGGLWHGAGWTFVFWGGLHGLYLGINHAFRDWAKAHNGAAASTLWRRIAGTALTMAAVHVAWVFFRATSLTGAFEILRCLVSPGRGMSTPRDALFLPMLLACSFIVWGMPNTQQWVLSRPEGDPMQGDPLDRWAPSPRWAFAIGGLLAVSIAWLAKPSVFIYFNF